MNPSVVEYSILNVIVGNLTELDGSLSKCNKSLVSLDKNRGFTRFTIAQKHY
jgi:hypothetical protein